MRQRLGVSLLTLVSVLAACAPGGERRGDLEPPEQLSPVQAMRAAGDQGFERAIEPRDFFFPRDHGPHPGFRLEWWYVVGHLDVGDGRDPPRRFGFQLTFFRQALASDLPHRPSAWAAGNLYMAHFAVTDVAAGRFHSSERFGRGAAGLAGARAAPFRVWLDDWSIAVEGDAGLEEAHQDFLPLRLRARADEVALDLVLDGGKPLVLQGEDGLSRKGPTPGNASYYYSFTRLAARGTVVLPPGPPGGGISLEGEELRVSGSAPGSTVNGRPAAWRRIRWAGTGSPSSSTTAGI